MLRIIGDKQAPRPQRPLRNRRRHSEHHPQYEIARDEGDARSQSGPCSYQSVRVHCWSSGDAPGRDDRGAGAERKDACAVGTPLFLRLREDLRDPRTTFFRIRSHSLIRMILTAIKREPTVSGFRVKFTLGGGTGVATSPPSDSLELAVDRAAGLERGSKVGIQGIVGPDGYVVVDRQGYARLLRERSGPR